MRKLQLTGLDLMKRRTYYSKLFRWTSDQEFFFDACEFRYDPSGKFMGVDYRKTTLPRQRTL